LKLRAESATSRLGKPMRMARIIQSRHEIAEEIKRLSQRHFTKVTGVKRFRPE
jgi:hypothetical protein